jgi:hypothetical protein
MRLVRFRHAGRFVLRCWGAVFVAERNGTMCNVTMRNCALKQSVRLKPCGHSIDRNVLMLQNACKVNLFIVKDPLLRRSLLLRSQFFQKLSRHRMCVMTC